VAFHRLEEGLDGGNCIPSDHSSPQRAARATLVILFSGAESDSASARVAYAVLTAAARTIPRE